MQTLFIPRIHWLILSTFLYTPSALAYIGPGLGSGAIAAVLGVIVAIIMLVVGVVWYPLKRLYRRFVSEENDQ